MYQALYRAWRPSTFTEICGQDAVTTTLKHQVMSGRIAHAYLFCGTRGTGKTTAAKVLARAINCLSPIDGDPCGSCAVCQALAKENCMDVMEIDAASNNGVDEIRDLREKIQYPPTVARYKTYIIDEVHMLSSGAFNALLKTLEEPPAHAVFILATTEPQKLPATVLSRCQRFDFHRIAADVIVARLRVVLKGIGRSADDDALEEIARAAEGGMRDALSLLDVCLSRTDNSVTAQLTREALGTAGRAQMFRFCDCLLNHDAPSALRLIDDTLRIGCDPQVFARDAAEHLRGILLAQSVGAALPSILECTAEDAAEFVRQSAVAPEAQIMRQMELFMRCDSDMKWMVRPRTMLELTAVRACHPETEQNAPLEERLFRLEHMFASGVAAPAKPDTPAKPAAPAKPAPRQPIKKSADAPQAYLDAVAKLSQENPSLVKPLQSASFAGYEDGVLKITLPKPMVMLLRLLENKLPVLENEFSQKFGEPVRVALLVEGAATSNKDARNTLNQAYDVFGREKIDLLD